MKKPPKSGVIIPWRLKFDLKMKLSLLFLITVSFVMQANSSYSQKTKISLDFGNATMEEVIDEIEANTEFKFIFNTKTVDLKRKVSITVKRVPIKRVLDLLFSKEGIRYEVDDRKILLTRAKMKASVMEVESAVISDLPQILVSGTITAQDGTPLPGANVVEKGTTNGVTADFDGNFSISVKDENAVVVVSYVGFATKEVSISGQTSLAVILEESAAGLAEVVVVGYGSQKKLDVTGSISTVGTDELKNTPGLRVDEMLQGKVSGMMVTQLNGSPGAPASIRIRGNSSISASSEPLYVVDGLIGVGDLNTINPADIANISVLKDASATAIYGSQGANGVILITTKKGTTGKLKINMNFQEGIQWLPRKIDVMDGPEYAMLLNKSRLALSGGTEVYPDPLSVTNTDWQDEIFTSALSSSLNLSFSGGSENFNYFVSGNIYSQDGIVENTGVDRIQVRANIESKFNDKLKLGTNINLGRVEKDNNVVGLGAPNGILTAPPTVPIYNENGQFYSDYPNPNFNGVYNNPVAELNSKLNESTSGNALINAFVQYNPWSWLTVKSTLGGVLYGFERNQRYTNGSLPTQIFNGQGGIAALNYSDNSSYQNENTISFTKQIKENHFLDGLIGLTFQGGKNIYSNSSAQGFVSDINSVYNMQAGDPSTRVIGSGHSKWNMISLLARGTYKYKDRYIVTATARRDGSSRLGSDNKWGFFPSLAVGWVATEEDFIDDLNVFSYLKIRASYGDVGNQAVGIYQTQSTYDSARIISNGQLVTAFAPNNIGNNSLKWETKSTFDLGIDGYFNDYINFTFDFYNSKTNDLLLNTEIPYQTGYLTRTTNVGNVSNVGFDITLNTTNVNKEGGLKWTTQLNISNNKNEVLQLGPSNADVITHRYTYGLNPVGILRVGEPVGSFYGAIYEGTWKSLEEIEQVGTMRGVQPGSQRYADTNGDGIFNLEDYVVLGSGAPTWYGGVENYFEYDGFGLGVFFTGATGNKIFNGMFPFLGSNDPSYNQYSEQLNAWDPVTNPDSNIPGNLNGERELIPSTRWIRDAAHIRLQTLSLFYNFPLGNRAKKLVESARINLTGTNLFVWSPYNKYGYDPVVNQLGGNDYGYTRSLQGFDYGAYPKSSTITLGVDITF